MLEPTAWPYRGLSPINQAVFALIIATVGLAVIETEPTIVRNHGKIFEKAELMFGILFLVEYCARVWTAVENPRFGPGWKGRLRYMGSATAMVDLLSIVISFATPTGMKPFMLRSFRILRILRLAKLGRMSSAMSYLIEAVQARRYEMFFSLVIGVSFLVLSATALYMVEGPVQPDKFGSIPRAMWWATATLTTIGYGDVYPITPLGKLFAAISAVAGIGLVALPTGIMAAAFSEAVQKHSEVYRELRHELQSRQTSDLDAGPIPPHD
jgi:voltage-gated potassium channel